VFVVFVVAWQVICRTMEIPRFLLPAPTDVVEAWIENRESLIGALISTFLSALIGFGLGLAQHPWLLRREVPVGLTQHRPDGLQRKVHRRHVEVRPHLAEKRIGFVEQRVVVVGEIAWLRDDPV